MTHTNQILQPATFLWALLDQERDSSRLIIPKHNAVVVDGITALLASFFLVFCMNGLVPPAVGGGNSLVTLRHLLPVTLCPSKLSNDGRERTESCKWHARDSNLMTLALIWHQ